MNQIKFRGFRKDGKGWVEGYLIGILDPTIEKDTVKHWLIHSGVNIAAGDKVEADSVGMFTGLTDKNGKQIFGSIPIDGVMSKGGDVLKSSVNERLFNWLIVFDNGGFKIRNIGVDGLLGDYFQTTQSLFYDREIIGNQYEQTQ